MNTITVMDSVEQQLRVKYPVNTEVYNCGGMVMLLVPERPMCDVRISYGKRGYEIWGSWVFKDSETSFTYNNESLTFDNEVPKYAHEIYQLMGIFESCGIDPIVLFDAMTVGQVQDMIDRGECERGCDGCNHLWKHAKGARYNFTDLGAGFTQDPKTHKIYFLDVEGAVA